MPGPLHQGLLHLLEHNPALCFELASHFDPRFALERARFEVAPNELPDPSAPGRVLHADWVVAAARRTELRRTASLAVEVQTCDDLLKYYSWLSYAAGVRRRFRCRGWTLVFAPDPDIRRRAQKMFEDEPRAAPWFVRPKMLPPILHARQAAADIDRAVLTAAFHARSKLGVACVRATLEAMTDRIDELELACPHLPVYRGIMHAVLTDEQLKQIPKRLLDIDAEAPLGPMELTSAYYVRGQREGQRKGQRAAIRTNLVRVLEARGLELDPGQRERIEACEEIERLEQWFERALVATSLERVLA